MRQAFLHNTYSRRYLGILCMALTVLLLGGCNRQEAERAGRDAQITEDAAERPETAAQQGETVAGRPESAAQQGEDAAGRPETAAQPEASAEAPVSAPEVTVVMVGDILLHTPVEESALQEDGNYDFNAVFANTAESIRAADVAIVNQEVIIGGEELGISGYPSFNAPYEAGDALVQAGFDVVCQGTNHALDKGERGVRSCLDFWKRNYPDIAVLGINESQEKQDSIYICEEEGIRIAILNYTYGTNGIDMPDDMPYAVNLLEEEKVLADIARAEAEADFTIVCPHWGTEYRLQPDSFQREWTELFLESGVDLVLGTHPHVIEPVEWLTDEETGHEMLVYYSLGNFVNWTGSSGEGIANRMVGGMAGVTIRLDEAGNAFIADYGVEALVCHLEEGMNGVTTYALADYPDALAERNAIIAQDENFSREYCERLCDEVWGELWH